MCLGGRTVWNGPKKAHLTLRVFLACLFVPFAQVCANAVAVVGTLGLATHALAPSPALKASSLRRG